MNQKEFDKRHQQFICKPREIILDKRLTPVEQDYLCLIAALQNAKGCTASNNWLARYFGVKRQTAQGAIGRLKDKNIIACTERKQGGKTIKRTIRIIDGNSRNILLTDSRENLPKIPMGLAGNSDKVSRKPSTHKTKDITKCAHRIKKPVCDDGAFDQFWQTYPKKQKKLNAQKAYRKLNPDPELIERIIKDVQRRSQRFDWQKENGKYVPLPDNYLNDQRWTDELPEPKRGDLDWLPDEQEAEEIFKEAGI